MLDLIAYPPKCTFGERGILWWAPDSYAQVLRNNPETICLEILEACVTDRHACPPPHLFSTALAHASLCVKVVFSIIKGV